MGSGGRGRYGEKRSTNALEDGMGGGVMTAAEDVGLRRARWGTRSAIGITESSRTKTVTSSVNDPRRRG